MCAGTTLAARLAVSSFEAVGELFDDGVGEDFAGDALDFGGGGFFVGEGGVEGEEEVLALADVGYAGVVHAAERLGDGLALGVEDGTLEGDINVGIHGS